MRLFLGEGADRTLDIIFSRPAFLKRLFLSKQRFLFTTGECWCVIDVNCPFKLTVLVGQPKPNIVDKRVTLHTV